MSPRSLGKLLGFTAFGLLMLHCSENKKSLVGLDFLQRDNLGSVERVVLQPSASDTFFQASVPTGNGPLLFFGKYGSVQAKTLIRFDTLGFTSPVDSMVLILKSPVILHQSEGLITVTVSALTRSWDESTICWKTFDEGSRGGRIASKTISTSDTSLEIVLPKEWGIPLVHSTRRTVPDGILIETDAPDGMVQAESIQNGNPAELKLYISSGVNIVNAVADAFVSEFPVSPESGRLYVVDGAALRTLLRFPLAGIPKRATVSRALLTLHVDNSVSFPPVQTDMGLMVYTVGDSVWSLSQIAIDSLNALTAVESEGKVSVNVTQFVQNWVSGAEANNGLLVGGGQFDPTSTLSGYTSSQYFESYDVDGLAFYSSLADSSNRPSLDVIYTVPPSAAF
jgi:hypothetical protein